MRAGWGPVAHVFVAVALALPVAAAVTAIGVAVVLPEQSMLNRWLLVLLGLGFCAVVGWAAALPPVRQVEVATARALLGVDLPDVPDPAAARSRGAGAAWLAVLVGVGLVVGLAVLYLLPTGVGLLAHPLTGRAEVVWPNRTGVWHTGSGWEAAWVAAVGLLCLVLLVAVVLVAARLLVRWAPPMLGPTAAERLTLAAARERDLARANALARDVHDTIGHALTAMTVQATVARRLLDRDRDGADRALAAVEELGRRAQADVDAVVGALRTGTEGSVRSPVSTGLAARVRALAAGVPLPVRLELTESLTPEPDVADAVEAVVREGLTNAVRHGEGPVTVRVTAEDDGVYVAIGNPLSEQPSPPAPADRSGAGLVGLQERLILLGGILGAGPEDGAEGDEWWLRAQIPWR
jgi:signal transduction histidine kinase